MIFILKFIFEFLLPLYIIILAIMMPVLYLTFKLALWIKLNGGYKGDAQSIVSGIENDFKKIKDFMFSLCPYKEKITKPIIIKPKKKSKLKKKK